MKFGIELVHIFLNLPNRRSLKYIVKLWLTRGWYTSAPGAVFRARQGSFCWPTALVLYSYTRNSPGKSKADKAKEDIGDSACTNFNLFHS